ncbi:50S ribosomal protein L32 [Candidatus Parcubacteria bacterium]|nr:MAG: 50S ribosomal protein L32 [Candidatus Parcubacteria bacterium]
MVVRMRANRSKVGKRRSHLRAESLRVSRCECGAERMAHRACPSCGKYNGKVIIDVVARTEREQRRVKRKEKALRESGQTRDAEKVAAS